MAQQYIDAQGFVDFATRTDFLDTPYIDHTTIPAWGPAKGWDCSSYTSYVFKKFGVSMDAYTDTQYRMGEAVARNDLQVGDLLFYHTDPNKVTGHVAIYLGNGMMAHAANPEDGTLVEPVYWSNFVGARRVLPNITGEAAKPSASGSGTDATARSAYMAGDGGQGQYDQYNGSTESYPTPDELSPEEWVLGNFGFTPEFLDRHPAIKDLFDKAIREDWMSAGTTGEQLFQNGLEQTPWWQNNSQHARDYIMNQAHGGADFEMQRENARETIMAEATKIGAVLSPEALEEIVTDYLMGGWFEPARRGMLTRALTGNLEGYDTSMLDMSKGGPQALITSLRSIAEANGVEYSDSYYESAAQSILGSMSTQADWEAEIRQTAASRFPIFSDRIRAGENARDIASPYINRMAGILELDAKEISLDDSWMTKAFGSMGEDGKPKAMSLWDFERSLRTDDRWQYTKNAHTAAADMTREVLSMFGFGG